MSNITNEEYELQSTDHILHQLLKDVSDHTLVCSKLIDDLNKLMPLSEAGRIKHRHLEYSRVYTALMNFVKISDEVREKAMIWGEGRVC